jgi:hypothetical protein
VFDNNKGVLIKRGTFEYEILAPKKTANVSKYIPEKKNFVNEQKSMLSYGTAISENSELLFYPSSLGASCELRILDNSTHAFSIALRIGADNVKVNKTSGGYWTLTTTTKDETGEKVEEIAGVIQAPLLKDGRGNVFHQNSLKVHLLPNKTYRLDFEFDKKPI